MKKIHIIGGGITGCSLCYFLKNNFSISLYEREPHLGGLIRTYKTIENLLYQKVPSILHTNDKWICDLFSKAVNLKPIEYNVAIDPLFDFQYYDFPFTDDSIQRLPWHWSEAIKMDLEKAKGQTANNLKQLIVNFYGETVYELFYKNLFKKMYGLDASSLNVVNWFRQHLSSKRYYNEKYIVFPVNEGYNNLFDFLTDSVDVHLNSEVYYTDFNDDIVIFTGYLRDVEYAYISFDIDSVYSLKENKPDRIYYPNYTPYYSITNYQKLFGGEKVVIVKESGEKEHIAGPIPKKSIIDIKENIYFAGRQGSYSFMDIADCVKQANKIATEIKIKERVR